MPEEQGTEKDRGIGEGAGGVLGDIFPKTVAVNQVQHHQQQNNPPDIDQQGKENPQQNIAKGENLNFIIVL